jgi:hypothetical protein
MMGSIRATTGSGPWPARHAATAQGRRRTIQETVALTRAAEGVLRPGDRAVEFTIEDSSVWPYVAAVVLELDERGVQGPVAPWRGSCTSVTSERLAGASMLPSICTRPTTSCQPIGEETVIADLDGAVLAYARKGRVTPRVC